MRLELTTGIHRLTSWVATLGALVLLAVPASGALIHVASPTFVGQGVIFHPLLPVPVPFAWALAGFGTVLFLLLRFRAIQTVGPTPLPPSRLAEMGGWQLLATAPRELANAE